MPSRMYELCYANPVAWADRVDDVHNLSFREPVHLQVHSSKSGSTNELDLMSTLAAFWDEYPEHAACSDFSRSYYAACMNAPAPGDKLPEHAHIAVQLMMKPQDFIRTRVRAFDVDSYFLCMMLIKRRSFGFINQKHFFFVDVDTGAEYELNSKQVALDCKATSAQVGDCYRIRETLRTRVK